MGSLEIGGRLSGVSALVEMSPNRCVARAFALAIVVLVTSVGCAPTGSSPRACRRRPNHPVPLVGARARPVGRPAPPIMFGRRP